MFACGGGDGGDGSSDPGDTVEEGLFLDAAAQGLTYQTPTQSGETDDEGTFEYTKSTPPENVTFSVGTLVIGSAPGQDIITPVDLVPGATDETDPTVTNISIFLLGMETMVTMVAMEMMEKVMVAFFPSAERSPD
jgi:hypothetical protein